MVHRSYSTNQLRKNGPLKLTGFDIQIRLKIRLVFVSKICGKLVSKQYRLNKKPRTCYDIHKFFSKNCDENKKGLF